MEEQVGLFMYSVHALSGGYRGGGVFHGACPLCLRAPHLFTMPHPRKIPGIDLYSGFIKNAQGGAIQNPKKNPGTICSRGGGAIRNPKKSRL